MNKWISYRLGDFLERKYNSVHVDDFSSYKRITIKTKGQGIVLRDEIEGTMIGTKNQFSVTRDQFLLSKIDAMNGAFGIVPAECDGGIITGNFWTFNINRDIIDQNYLQLLCIKQEFTKFSIQASEGTTNRKYLKEDKFLALPILLPALAEQRRIVSKIDSIQGRVEQIVNLRKEQFRHITHLLFSRYTELISGVEWMHMKDVAPIARREVHIEDEKLYPELGIRCFGKGAFHKPALSGLELGTKKIFQIKENDLIFSNVFAWEGGIAVARKDDNNRFGSHRFISCVVDKKKALPDFLCYYFLTPNGLIDINACSPGGAGRNKTLGLGKLMQMSVPVPDISLQKEFVELMHKMNTLMERQSKSAKELSTLIPSLLDKELKRNYDTV